MRYILWLFIVVPVFAQEPQLSQTDMNEMSRLSFVRMQAEEAVAQAQANLQAAQQKYDAAVKALQAEAAKLQGIYKKTGCGLGVNLEINDPPRDLWAWKCPVSATEK